MNVGYKLALTAHNNPVIVTLEIMGCTNEMRDDVCYPDFAKFRCSCARVLDIRGLYENHNRKYRIAETHPLFYCPGDEIFYYKKRELVIPHNWCEDINLVCEGGIHYFKTREAVYEYAKDQLGVGSCGSTLKGRLCKHNNP